MKYICPICQGDVVDPPQDPLRQRWECQKCDARYTYDLPLWTREKPTVDGYYWIRAESGSEPAVAWVHVDSRAAWPAG